MGAAVVGAAVVGAGVGEGGEVSAGVVGGGWGRCAGGHGVGAGVRTGARRCQESHIAHE